MIEFLLKTGLAMAVAMACVSCDKIKPPQPELQKPPTQGDQTVQLERERKAFTQTAEKELDELREAIAGFRAKAGVESAEAQARLNQEIDKLEAQSRDMQQRLRELKSATLESWHQVTDPFARALDQLKAGVENFRKSRG